MTTCPHHLTCPVMHQRSIYGLAWGLHSIGQVVCTWVNYYKNFTVSPVVSEINFIFLKLSVLISIWIYTGFKGGEGLGGRFFLWFGSLCVKHGYLLLGCLAALASPVKPPGSGCLPFVSISITVTELAKLFNSWVSSGKLHFSHNFSISFVSFFFKKRKVLPFNSWERRTEPNCSLPFHPLTARSLTCLRLLMLLYTRVTVTHIQNYHSTPPHRASQSCSFPSKFPLHLISEEEASNNASSAPWKTQTQIYWSLWHWNYDLFSSFPNFL